MKFEKRQNKRDKKTYWHCRFELNNKTFRPKAETKEKLEKLVREIQNQEEAEQLNKKYNIDREIVSFVPTIESVLYDSLPSISSPSRQVFAERVFENFLYLLPESIKVDELKKHHFQKYIDSRKTQIALQSKKPVKLQTIYKELYAVRTALKTVRNRFDTLEDWIMPDLPELPKGFKKKTRRERLVMDSELKGVIAELMKEPSGKQTQYHYFVRVRLAHTLEFGYETGLRRKEIARLKFSQFNESDRALLNVKRWKTDSATKFFPLSRRAVEIINTRRKLQGESDFIFTPDGEPTASTYRTLKNVCEDLEIPYGRFNDDGFIPHDLRHNFGTEIMRNSDIETARELLGHSDIKQTGTYAHTDATRMRDAVRKREKIDHKTELETVFDTIEKRELSKENFIEKMREMFGF